VQARANEVGADPPTARGLGGADELEGGRSRGVVDLEVDVAQDFVFVGTHEAGLGVTQARHHARAGQVCVGEELFVESDH